MVGINKIKILKKIKLEKIQIKMKYKNKIKKIRTKM